MTKSLLVLASIAMQQFEMTCNTWFPFLSDFFLESYSLDFLFEWEILFELYRLLEAYEIKILKV